MGWEHKFYCEIDEFCRKVLKFYYPNAKAYEDLRRTHFDEWRGKIDVLTAGFPCQPFSTAGKRKGTADDRYLWPEVLRAIDEIRPAWFVGENVVGITSMVLPGEEVTVANCTDLFGADYVQTKKTEFFLFERICQDIETIGYELQPFIIPACSVEAPHRRDRVWFIAYDSSGQYSENNRETGKLPGFQTCYKHFISKNENSEIGRVPPIADSSGKFGFPGGMYASGCQMAGCNTRSSDAFNFRNAWQNFPSVSPLCERSDGLSYELSSITFSKWRQEAIKALGNSVVPQVVFQIFQAIEKADSLANQKTKP